MGEGKITSHHDFKDLHITTEGYVCSVKVSPVTLQNFEKWILEIHEVIKYLIYRKRLNKRIRFELLTC